MLARRGEPDSPAIDLILTAGGAETRCVDQQLTRLAACEVEDLAGDQTIEHDHVGGLQRADRTHRQQVWIGGDVDKSD